MKTSHKIMNAIVLILTAWILFQYVSLFFKNSSQTDQKVSSLPVKSLSGDSIELLKQNPGPLILFFWSSTCPPCMVELLRFQSATSKNELPKDRVVMINMNESPEVINAYLKKREVKLPNFIATNELLATLKVTVTPTIVHIDSNNVVKHFSSGVGPLTIVRAKNFIEADTKN